MKMKSNDIIAKVETSINVSVAQVWDALVNSSTIKKYMFGTTVISDWKEGSKIVWTGEWQGKSYEDKGTILQLKPMTKLQYTHFSPLTGLPDIPENYHTVTVELTDKGKQTIVSLSQDNNSTQQAKEHSEKNWGMMLASLKKLLE